MSKITSVAPRFFKYASVLFTFDERTTKPTDACASIQLDAKRSSANIRASAGLLTSRSKSLDASIVPSVSLTVLAESLETVTKLDVKEMVTSF